MKFINTLPKRRKARKTEIRLKLSLLQKKKPIHKSLKMLFKNINAFSKYPSGDFFKTVAMWEGGMIF